MFLGFSSELSLIEKEAGLGKFLTGAALISALAGGTKTAPKVLNKLKPTISHTMERVTTPSVRNLRSMGSSAGQMADRDVASALSFR